MQPEFSKFTDALAETLVVGDQLGQLVDERFEIVAVIGQGSMSTVYRARDTTIDRQVALKAIDPGLLVDPEALGRFQRAAVAACSLEHPGIVKMLSSGMWGERPYVTMELIDGENLAQVLRREQRLELEPAQRIFLEILEALRHAHEHGIIHRDLKPNNVMLVGAQQSVKLVDFGIAKILPESGKMLQTLTQTGHIVGSLAYMSPEQCMGFPVDARSDIYSMGCLMYETLVGQPAIYGVTDYAIVARQLKEPPKASEYLQDDFGKVVFWALAKDRDNRPQSAEALIEAVNNPHKVKAATARGATRSAPRKALPRWLLLGLTVVCLGLSLLLLTLPPRVPDPGVNTYLIKRADRSLESHDLDDAERLFKEVIDTARRVGDRTAIAQGNAGLMQVAVSDGDVEEATKLARAIANDPSSLQLGKLDAEFASKLALAFQLRGDAQWEAHPVVAQADYQTACDLMSKRAGTYSSVTNSFLALASAHFDKGEFGQAAAAGETFLSERGHIHWGRKKILTLMRESYDKLAESATGDKKSSYQKRHDEIVALLHNEAEYNRFRPGHHSRHHSDDPQ